VGEVETSTENDEEYHEIGLEKDRSDPSLEELVLDQHQVQNRVELFKEGPEEHPRSFHLL
jgi:hypothetical protein